MTNKKRRLSITYAIFREQSESSGDDGVEETLLPIPNRTVKLYSVDGTAGEALWESRTLPGYICVISSVGRAPDS